MNIDLLLSASVTKRKTIEVAGQKVICKEPNGIELAEYNRLRQDVYDEKGKLQYKGNAVLALATLFKTCVLDENEKIFLSDDQAYALANGPGRVVYPIANAILKFTVDDLKNGTAPTDGISED